MLESVSVESGDYQVQVHIIEVRDLVAKDLEGTSDPIAVVKYGKPFPFPCTYTYARAHA